MFFSSSYCSVLDYIYLGQIGGSIAALESLDSYKPNEEKKTEVLHAFQASINITFTTLAPPFPIYLFSSTPLLCFLAFLPPPRLLLCHSI